jgi:hypothetical protein
MKDLEFSKQFAITFDYRSTYLYAYVEADGYSYAIVDGYCQRIAEECKKIECTKVLIKENIAERVCLAEAYKISSEIPQTYFAGMQIAFVDQYIDQDQLNRFGEIVAVNHGLNGRMFSSESDAEKWLLKTA